MNAEKDLQLWSSLPIPAILLDADERIADMNPAAEGFMNNSAKWLMGQPIWDRLAVDAPLEESLARAREKGTPLYVNDVDVGTGSRPPLVCNLSIAPVQNQPGWMILLISPRELAGRMTQSNSAKSAAKSAIGMAEMLAHEIKNPLAGITGAAQLLSMNLEKDDLELTDLIVAEIKGPEGTDVTLGIRKAGKGKVRDFTLTRAEIRVPITANRVREVDGRKLGYVQLTTFSQGAGLALRRAVERVLEKGAEGVVLDLRDNGGGLLEEAIFTSSVFLDEGDVVVETRSRSEGDATYRAVGGNIDSPTMVVLVNRNTASAAEILAAALQTDLGIPVVGTRTYGKGLFQQVIDLSNGGSLDLSVGEFLTADGVSLAGKGLAPDVRAPLPRNASRDVQLDRAFGVLSDEIASGAQEQEEDPAGN